MTTISAKVIADSISPQNIRLTTLQLEFPRYILAEFNTHRMFSRNAASSRAIPTKRALDTDKIVEPIRWGLNQSGMQSAEQNLEESKLEEAKYIWKHMAEICREGSLRLAELGLHKQWTNRPTEWFRTVKVLVTSTYWKNWNDLRDHSDAMPEIEKLAQEIKKAISESVPENLHYGDWHVPYITLDDWELFYSMAQGNHEAAIELAIRCSVARCARVSYLTHEGKKPDWYKDLKLYEQLVKANPPHMSPLEHQAIPDKAYEMADGSWLYDSPKLHGNFYGWKQYRKMIPNERVKEDWES